MIERYELLNYTKNKLGTVEVAIELGVQLGDHALLIDEIVKPEKLYLLDVFGDADQGVPDRWLSGWKSLDKVNERFSEKEHVEIIINTTEKGSELFENEHFDFIYIDADHRYESVKKDLNNWFPKMKKGGIFAGHDYVVKKDFGVIQAVDEFVKENNIKNFKTFSWPGHPWNISWLIEV